MTASFLYGVLMPLFFSWLLPILTCNLVWKITGAPQKPGRLFLTALYPLVFVGLIVGQLLASYLRPEFYAGRSVDGPGAAPELTLAFFLSWTYIPVINRLARMKQKGYSRKVNFIELLRALEIVLWIPISLGLFVSLNSIFLLIVGHRDFKTLGLFFIPILAVLLPLRIRRLRNALIKKETPQKSQE